ncbi:MAG: hypothetical protein H0T72_14465, partial [Chloroflexia bacterium]|nr:hypothetical protein [Chloroflexia bacterium]
FENGAAVTGGSAPSLVIVTAGSVSLDDGSTLAEGEMTTVDGEVSLTANESDAVVAVATIGDDVSLPAVSDESGESDDGESDGESDGPAATPVVGGTDPEPTPVDETEPEATLESSVSILVEAIDCSNGDSVSWENCTPLEGVLFSLARAEETSSSETGITTDSSGQVYDIALAGTTVTVAYASGAPEGLVPLTGPFTAEDVQDGQVFLFVFGTADQQAQ